MAWEIVIGLETHTQLSTHTKIFSGSSTQFGALPNTQANEVDLALPGSLPVMNRMAVEKAIRFGLAVGATIAPRSIFARKNYFYPDLPKNYQISQYDQPLCLGGPFPDGHILRRAIPHGQIRLSRNSRQAESFLRPRARRAASTLRPPTVAVRARKPWRRARTSRLG